jgi:hypothetical protein
MAFLAEHCVCAGPTSIGAVSARWQWVAAGSRMGLGAGVRDQSNECESFEVIRRRRGEGDQTWMGRMAASSVERRWFNLRRSRRWRPSKQCSLAPLHRILQQGRSPGDISARRRECAEGQGASSGASGSSCARTATRWWRRNRRPSVTVPHLGQPKEVQLRKSTRARRKSVKVHGPQWACNRCEAQREGVKGRSRKEMVERLSGDDN